MSKAEILKTLQELKIVPSNLVLRIVFDEPLVFDANTGFYTASLSLPVAISCTTGQI